MGNQQICHLIALRGCRIQKSVYNLVTMKENNSTFAIIETGGKQLKVMVGDVVLVEKLGDDMQEGAKIVFDKVLCVDTNGNTTLGFPYIDKTSVTGEFMSEEKGKKIKTTLFRAKSNWQRTFGHRQKFSKVKITAIA